MNDGIATKVPVLSIATMADAAVLSWSANGTWILETASGLSGVWSPVPAVPITGAIAFYRLGP